MCIRDRLSDSLGNTPKENQAILEQLSALTGGSSDQVLSVLNALGLLDEEMCIRDRAQAVQTRQSGAVDKSLF